VARPLRYPFRRAVALGVVALALTTGACSSTDKASGDFTPAHTGVLTVATSEVPLPGMWAGSAAHPTGGFEYELAVALAHDLGLARVKIVIVPFDRVVSGHLDGADLALSDLTATQRREESLDFTNPYLAATPAALVRTGTDVADLHTAQGLRWAVGRATTLLDFLRSTVQPDRDPLITRSQRETVDALEQRRVDAGLLDLPVAAAIAEASHGRLAVAGQFDANDDLSAALPAGSSNLDAVSTAVRGLVADGAVSSLAKRWLGLDIDGTQAQQVPLIHTNS
jgi:ABC-type amino acid transport substrate-binding protein